MGVTKGDTRSSDYDSFKAGKFRMFGSHWIQAWT